MKRSSFFHKWLSGALALAIALYGLFPAGNRVWAAADGSQPVISQVYGGGGNSGSYWKQDFVELYNPAADPVDLAGWKLRYASANGSYNETNVTALSGTIPAGGYYLVQQAAGTGGVADLEGPDQTGTLNLSGSAGKVELLDADGDRADLVGYGNANEAEGDAVPALSNTTAAIRKAAPGADPDSRGLDTDNNANDFDIAEPAPRNSSYGFNVPPAVASPAAGAWPAGTPVTLSSSVPGAVIYVSQNGSGSSEPGPFLPYEGPITLNGETVIQAYVSSPPMADSPVTEFRYTELSKMPVEEARLTPRSHNVWTEGIVTHIDGQEMYIQDDNAGIVLYGFPSFAEPGDRVNVQGVMDIYRNLEEIKPLDGLNYSVSEPGAGVPDPISVTASDLSPDQGERYEAMLVKLEDVTIVSKNGSNVTASQGDNTFTIYSGLTGLREGATFEQITGVVKQFDSSYQLIPLGENALVESMLSVMASPAPGSIITGTSVELTSPTADASIFYTVDGTDPTTDSLAYTVKILVDSDITIKAIAVSGSKVSRIYTFSYVASSPPRIHSIQGEGHTSPYNGQFVTDVEGVVTQIGYTFNNAIYRGFYIQDPQPDGNPNTSEGIFVYSTDATRKPEVGNLVAVSGTVTEYNEGSNANRTTTQITLSEIHVIEANAALPEPVVLGKDGRSIPDERISGNPDDFDPDRYAMDFYESLEGMLVSLPSPTILSPYWTSGGGNSLVYNIPTRIDNGAKEVLTPAGGLVLKEAGNLNPQRLLLAYGNPGMEVGTGDTFNGDVVGVIGYNNGNYKVIPAEGSLPDIVKGSFEQETASIQKDEDKLLVAAYNIENYYPGVGADKIGKLAKSIAVNLKQPDIIAVVEMQDGNGETNNGQVEADATALIAAIRAEGGPDYVYTDIAPVNNADGGAPGGNIRVGFLYNPSRVTLSDSVQGRKGTATEAAAFDAEQGILSVNPGRIDPENPAFASSRKPLAAQFDFKGEQIILVASHFNSKSGDNGPFGAVQPPVLSSERQRHQIAAVVNGFVKDVLSQDPDANLVVLGDLNDFQFTETARILRGNELDNLIDKLPLGEQYTYTFDGNSQVLDHILVSKNLSASAEVDIVHLNADFPASHGRVSDHDPVLAQLDFNRDAGFPLTVLHTNDTHANLDTTNSPNSILRRVTAIKETRASAVNPLLVDAGDVFSGTLYFNQYLGQADLAFMNLAGYDAMTFGNHEFDKDSKVLSDFISNAEFPFVSSNVDFSQDQTLNKLFHAEAGSPGDKGRIYPVLIKDIGGEQVGLIGLTTEDTANIASPGDVTFNEAVSSAREAVNKLEQAGINKIIALSHLGFEADKELAKAVSGLDIIVGGHSHTKLDEPVVDLSNPDEPTLIVQTGEKGQFLGRLAVQFDGEGRLTEWDGHLIAVDGLKEDKSYIFDEDIEAAAILAEYKPGVEELLKKKVGTTEIVLDGVRENVRSKETNLGNLIADGMLYAAKQAGTDAVIALQNGGGIRASIDQGTITQGDILTVLPYNNDLVTITLTGQEIREALENGVSTVTTTKDGRFPHVAGMRFYYDSTRPVHERIQRIEIRKGNSYVPLQPDASYTVATNAFTARGGDFYSSLEKAYQEGRVNLLYLPDYEVFMNYINHLGTITARDASVQGRIIDLKGSALPSPPPSPAPAPSPVPGNPVPNPAPLPMPSATPAPAQSPAPSQAPAPTAGTGTVAPQVTEIGEADLQARLAAIQSQSQNPVIAFTALEGPGGSSVILPGQVLAAQAGQQPDTLLVITAGDAAYSLPLRVLTSTPGILAALNAPDAKLNVAITPAAPAVVSGARESLSAMNPTFVLAGPVVDFNVSVESGGNRLSVNNFGNTFVSRVMTTETQLQSDSATAVSFDPANGAIAFVPSLLTPGPDGTTQVTIKRNSNSYYTVIQGQPSFPDVPGQHWASASIHKLAAKLIINGKEAGRYVPSDAVTRAEFAALIVRSLGLQPAAGSGGFSDVGSAAWYAPAIRTAQANGLINGYEDGRFRPDQTVTRQEMAAILMKAISFTGTEAEAGSSAQPFKDSAAISGWAQQAVAQAAASGIVQGTPDGQFLPQANATRAEAAVMLGKTLQLMGFIN